MICCGLANLWTCFSSANENVFDYENENAAALNVSFFDGESASFVDVEIESHGNAIVSLSANAYGLSTASASCLEMGNYCSNHAIVNVYGFLSDSAFDRQNESVFVHVSVIAYVFVIEIFFVHGILSSFYRAIETFVDQGACEVLYDFVSVVEGAHASYVAIEIAIDCDGEIEAAFAAVHVSCYEI